MQVREGMASAPARSLAINTPTTQRRPPLPWNDPPAHSCPARLCVCHNPSPDVRLWDARGQKKVDGKDWEVTCVSMGNPHAVVFVPDVDALDLPALGPQFETHPSFPAKINTEFVQVTGRGGGNTSAVVQHIPTPCRLITLACTPTFPAAHVVFPGV